MAIEMANVLRSLNSMLDSKEQRQRFDVQAALSGMEIAMKREQQRIGEKQFKEELSLKRRGMKIQEEELGIAKDTFKMQKEERFMEEVAQLGLIVENEKIKAASGTWTSYFSGIHDNYFRSGNYTETERKKLTREINKNIHNLGTSKQITNLIAKYGSSLTSDGKGNTELMMRLAHMMGDKLPTDVKFAKGMQKFLGIDDSYDGAVFQKDFTDLLQYDIMADKLTQEQLEVSKGDYEFSTGILGDVEEAREENLKGEEGFNYVRVGSQTVNRQDIVDYANENEISYEDAKRDIVDLQESSRQNTGDARLDALLEIEKLSGEKRLQAIASELSEDERYGISGYDSKQGFTMSRKDIDGEDDIEEHWMDKTGREGQRRQVGSRMSMVEQEMGITNRGIRELEEKMEGRKRGEEIMGITYSGTEQASKDAVNLASMKLAAEAYRFQTEKLREQERSLLTLTQREQRDAKERRKRMGMYSTMQSFR